MRARAAAFSKLALFFDGLDSRAHRVCALASSPRAQDHSVELGCRVKVNDTELAELHEMFGEVNDSRFTRCVVCNRTLTGGDFGLDHTFFCHKGDPERRVIKVRTIPRIWCVDCAKGRAKQQGKPYATRKGNNSFLAKWKAVAADLQAATEQAAKATADAEAAERASEEEASAAMAAFLARADVVAGGAWLNAALVDADAPLEFAKPKRTLVVGLTGVDVLGGETAVAEGADASPDAPLICLALRFRWTGTCELKSAVGGVVGVSGEAIGQLRFDGEGADAPFDWVAGGATRAEVTAGLQSSHAGATRAEAVRMGEGDASDKMIAVAKKRELLVKFWQKKAFPLVLARLAERGGPASLTGAL